MHVHVESPKGEAKFWLEPTISLANFAGYTPRELKLIQKVVEANCGKFRQEWKKYFIKS